MFYRTLLLLQAMLCSGVMSDYQNYEDFDTAGESKFRPTVPLQDILKNLGLLESFNSANYHIMVKVREAEKYNNYQRDWKKLKSEPLNLMNIVNFVKNTTLPAIVRSGMMVQKIYKNLYISVMSFTRKQCDKVLGPEAPMHPWNIVKQGKETVSFLVFVYATCLSLLLFKLCSFWNFLGLLTFGYMMYCVGGPYLFFKWLVFITGTFWYMFDLILKYPLYTSALFLVLYCWTYLLSFPLFFGHSAQSMPKTAAVEQFTFLRKKVSKIEDRTDEIQKKVEELEDLFKRMDFGKDI